MLHWADLIYWNLYLAEPFVQGINIGLILQYMSMRVLDHSKNVFTVWRLCSSHKDDSLWRWCTGWRAIAGFIPLGSCIKEWGEGVLSSLPVIVMKQDFEKSMDILSVLSRINELLKWSIVCDEVKHPWWRNRQIKRLKSSFRFNHFKVNWTSK